MSANPQRAHPRLFEPLQGAPPAIVSVWMPSGTMLLTKLTGQFAVMSIRELLLKVFPMTFEFGSTDRPIADLVTTLPVINAGAPLVNERLAPAVVIPV